MERDWYRANMGDLQKLGSKPALDDNDDGEKKP